MEAPVRIEIELSDLQAAALRYGFATQEDRQALRIRFGGDDAP
jgi:hypothetical protein